MYYISMILVKFIHGISTLTVKWHFLNLNYGIFVPK